MFGNLTTPVATSTNGSLRTIESDSTGEPYTVNKIGEVYYTTSYTLFDSTTYDFVLSNTDQAWIIKREDMLPYALDPSNNQPLSLGTPTMAEMVRVGDTIVYTIDRDGVIKEYDGSSWTTLPGNALDAVISFDDL